MNGQQTFGQLYKPPHATPVPLFAFRHAVRTPTNNVPAGINCNADKNYDKVMPPHKMPKGENFPQEILASPHHHLQLDGLVNEHGLH